MEDLSKFRRSCLYCFHTLENTLNICACYSTLCDTHLSLHCSKKHCKLLAKVKTSEDEKVLVTDSKDPNIEERELEVRIQTYLKTKEMGLKTCPHSSEMEFTDITLEKRNSCNSCSLDENLWICGSCGHIGCGRKQPEAQGNGHALAHFDEMGHCVVFPESSITSNGVVEAYCYKCDDYIVNPSTAKVVNLCEKERDNEKQEDASLPFTGIKNSGQTCYIASALQLLSQALVDKNMKLTSHFELCEDEPLECFICQFIKIIIQLQEYTPNPPVIDISDFLELVYVSMPVFEKGVQQDAADFLQVLLERLSFYEETGLIPSITGLFTFKTENTVKCEKCGKNEKNEVSEKILYVKYSENLMESIKGYFSGSTAECSCGTEEVLRFRMKELPDRMLVAVKRYEMANGIVQKITGPINVPLIPKSEIVDGAEGEYKLKACVCHSGGTLACGHYTYWIDCGGEYFTISDTLILPSTLDESQNGVVFLFQSSQMQ